MGYSSKRQIPLVVRRAARAAGEGASAAELPVVAYVRMSTEHQQYSIANQLDRIKDYASRRRMRVIRAFEDDGKSGLRIDGREGLQELIRIVQCGAADFRAILVYDVSRWGRFQDADESGYYEYLCRRAGITVHYCAEEFENDGSPSSNIIKSVKRSMAGEYSRELSTKVFQGACRLIRLGYKQGGTAGFGLRRMVIDPAGNPRGILEAGQQKFLATDRVVLVPGPDEEVKVVRKIFADYVLRGLSSDKIAEELNTRGIPNEQGRKWKGQAVHNLLCNEKYIGNLVYCRHTQRLSTRMVLNPPEKWIRVEGVFPAIVDQELFCRAVEIRRQRRVGYTDEELLAALKELLLRKGRLSGELLKAEHGMPAASTYAYRWGSLIAAYNLIGYGTQRDRQSYRVNRELAAKRGEVLRTVEAELRARGVAVTVHSDRGILEAQEVSVYVVCARCQRTKYRTLQWTVGTKPATDLTLVVRMAEDHQTVWDYFLFPSLDRRETVVLRPHNHLLIEAYRCMNLDRLVGLLTRQTVETA
jgi:DNA invertase Pin-like site-specific DNA recombinase